MAARRRRVAHGLTLDDLYPGTPDEELELALDAAFVLTASGDRRHRIDATRFEPFLFGVLYLGHHLLAPIEDELAAGLDWDDDDDLVDDPEADKVITAARFHLQLCGDALVNWTARPSIRAHRDLYAAPRDSGKSTWLYLILPLWAAAHGWSRFAASFADAASQAEQHLGSMRLEFDNNELLRHDFPELCAPMHRGGRRRTTISDRIDQLHQANDFRIVAKGIDRSTLGLKIGNLRPDLLLLDDLEPDEARYSEALAKKRRQTFLEAVLPMNLRARVAYTGTVTMFGSIVHQALRHAAGELSHDEKADAEWVERERFRVHHILPIIDHPDGSRSSYWESRYPLVELEAMEGTRSYRKNYLNKPLAGDGDFWREELYRYETLDGYGATILYVDPAVKPKSKTKGKGWTGLAVVSRSPAGAERAIHVRYTTRVRMVGQRLRDRVTAILADHPDIRVIVVEENQGGDYTLENLEDLGPRVVGHYETLSKEVRADRVLDYYERPGGSKIIHAGPQPLLEAEQTGFPDADTRDVLDAVNGAVLWLLRRRKKKGSGSTSYL